MTTPAIFFSAFYQTIGIESRRKGTVGMGYGLQDICQFDVSDAKCTN